MYKLLLEDYQDVALKPLCCHFLGISVTLQGKARWKITWPKSLRVQIDSIYRYELKSVWERSQITDKHIMVFPNKYDFRVDSDDFPCYSVEIRTTYCFPIDAIA